MALFCKHSRVEVFEDKKTGKYFAECNICEAVGALAESTAEARRELKKLKAQRPHGQGGVREGAGRKKMLSTDAKFFACTLEPTQIAKLDKFIVNYNKWAEKSGLKTLNSRSAGLREILTQLKV